MSRYHAPVVHYPIAAPCILGYGVAAVVVLVAVVLLGWAWRVPAQGLPAPVFAAVLFLYLLCAGLAVRFVWRLPRGNLHWDGRVWHWNGQALESQDALRVHWDAQRCLLLSLRLQGQPDAWLWLERRADPSRWGDLRRAVYSRARPSTADFHPHADADRGQA